MARREARREKVDWASLPQVSTTSVGYTPNPALNTWVRLLCASWPLPPLLHKLAAVRMEGMKGEVTVMSRAACFPLSQLRTSTSAGWVWP